MSMLPESITAGVTTGHVAHHEELHERFNNEFFVSDTGAAADIADALVDAHNAGGGVVRCQGLSYTGTSAAGVALLSISLPTVSLDLNGATITYTGAGICLRKRMDPMTNTPCGLVMNGTIDGTGSSDGAVGIETGHCVSGTWLDVRVYNFTGTGSVNWDFYNPGYPAGAPTSGWYERNKHIGIESQNGKIAYRFRAVSPWGSYLYNSFVDMRFNVGSGQTALKTEANTQLYDCILNLFGNVDDDGTIFDLAADSILRPSAHITIEQTNGTGAILFAPGSSDMVYPHGTILVAGFPDYDADIVISDYEGRGVGVVLATKERNAWAAPSQASGFTVGDGSLGHFFAVYDGGAGADVALLKIPFGGALADARVAAQLDSVTRAEIGFRPGVFDTGGRPAPSSVPIGTMIYHTTQNRPEWSDGTNWRTAAGVIS